MARQASRLLHAFRAGLLATFAVVAAASQAAIPASERAALVDFYNNTAGASWTNTTAANAVWTTSASAGNECSWFGVVCAVTLTGHTVTEINLPSNNLVGALPASIVNLPSLQYLRLQSNALSGPIPPLAPLTSLEYVDVRSNQLTGPLPALASLTALKVFNFESNQISGAIPALGSLAALEFFLASNNQLTSVIPSLSGLTRLRFFHVDNNQLFGLLPSLAGLSALESFYAQNNALTGSVPALAGLTALTNFRAENNQLTGALPSLAGLNSLRVFYVRNNQLSGAVVAVPSPTNALTAALSALCPNQLTVSVDAAWDAATGSTPWSTGCTAPRNAQTLAFGAAPSLIPSGTGTVTATASPTPNSAAPVAYSSLSPLICTVNSSSGLVTVSASAVAGNACIIAANKAGDAAFNSAPQVQQSITIVAPVNGVCGGAQGVLTLVAPAAGSLCAAGTASAVTAGASAFTWMCNGLNSGTNASCSAPRAYTVTPSLASADGSISPSTPQVVAAGATQAFTITPNAGFAISGVSGTCGGALVGNVFTTNAVSASDCTVIVSFVASVNGSCGAAQGVLTAVAPAPATLCASGTASAVVSGASAFTWTCNGQNSGTNASCSAPRAYLVSPTVSSANGNITPNTPQAVAVGATQSFTITPLVGYRLVQVLGTCGGTLVGNVFTTNPITAADCTVNAVFAQDVIAPVPSLPRGLLAVLGAMVLLSAGLALRRAR